MKPAIVRHVTPTNKVIDTFFATTGQRDSYNRVHVDTYDELLCYMDDLGFKVGKDSKPHIFIQRVNSHRSE